MLNGFTDRSLLKQYIISIIVTISVSAICYPLSPILGYVSVALVLLFMVSILSVILSIFPVLVSAILSALIWDFFFIPPFFTFHVEKTEDILILGLYVTIALINGILNSRIKRYEKLARQREDRTKTLKLYNAIFNSISHELRTPLTTIMGVTENLSDGSQRMAETDKEQLYNELFIASNRLNRVVDNLMNMSRVESGHLEPKFDWCDVRELVNRAIDRLSTDLQTHPLHLEFGEDLPIVRLDFGLTEQAIYNILHNICFHTPEGTKASFTVTFDEGILRMVIRDEGPGFREEDRKRAFEKFYRSSGARSGGLGLGLSIARGFIQAQGGEISISNSEKGGAEFSISLPVNVFNINTENE